MKKIMVTRLVVCIIIFVAAIMLGVSLGHYVGSLDNRTSTETGYEAYILDHWNENQDTKYKLGISAYVQIEDLGQRTDGRDTNIITAVYNIYNKHGKLIGSGYIPEVFK